MALPVALQLYSIRDVLDRDFEGSIRQIAEMGYDGVELLGFSDELPAREVRSILDGCGLSAVSAHCPFDVMRNAPEETFEKADLCGCRRLVIPWMDIFSYAPDRLDQTLEQIAALGQRAREHGLTLQYHNHDFEFTKIGEEYILDLLYRTIPADCLQTQLDTCWVRVAGEDPVAYLKKYAGRAPTVHLKDFSGTKGRGMYDLIGKTAAREKKDTDFAFRPLGGGKQDIPSLLQASEEAGAEWVIVEQDESPDMPTLQAAQISRQYLKSLGW